MLSPFSAQEPCARSSRPGRARAWIRRAAGLLTAAGLGGALLGCSPALDWRQAGPARVDVLMDFPCKPQTVTQAVTLAGRRLDMSMTGCETAHMTFALAHADVGQGPLVAPALAELRQAAQANIAARVLQQRTPSIRHAADGDAAPRELDLAGRDPRGGALREHVLLFSQGTQVFQATVLARESDYKDDAARTFAGSVQLGAGPAPAPAAPAAPGSQPHG